VRAQLRLGGDDTILDEIGIRGAIELRECSVLGAPNHSDF
jgi:hypothetical protein